MNVDRLRVPLSWVASNPLCPFPNFGDALSAIVVSAMAGIPTVHADFDANIERVVGIGTIGHEQKNGILHFWGTGVDATRNPLTGHGSYTKPADTLFRIHAVRGPRTAATLLHSGIDVPQIYGDPGWLLPHVWPLTDVNKTHELGVVLHISELADETPYSGPAERFIRYQIPFDLQNEIKIINTFCAPRVDSVQDKIREIVSCRRIVSTSLHGLVIAETYGIPCSWFSHASNEKGGMLEINNPDAEIDHRIADFYAGVGREVVNAFCWERGQPTDWAELIAHTDRTWTPVLDYDELALINAFPLPCAVSPGSRRWSVAPELLSQLIL